MQCAPQAIAIFSGIQAEATKKKKYLGADILNLTGARGNFYQSGDFPASTVDQSTAKERFACVGAYSTAANTGKTLIFCPTTAFSPKIHGLRDKNTKLTSQGFHIIIWKVWQKQLRK